MKIVHIGPFKIGTANGSYNALWSLACSQVKLGHEVFIIRVGKNVTDEQRELASREGVNLIGFPCSKWASFWKDDSGCFSSLIEEIGPDIVHLQYVRIPKYSFISKFLRSKGVPYVISLHAGMNSVEMRRKGIRKRLYWHFVERKVHMQAAGLHFVTQREFEDYCSNLGAMPSRHAVIPNTVTLPQQLPEWSPQATDGILRFVYLGRYDVWAKGIDLMLTFLSELRNLGLKVELHLYGTSSSEFDRLLRRERGKHAEVPLIDHGFVTGVGKFIELTAFDFYIQYSRYELYGMSLVEALALGIPSLVSENCDLSLELTNHNAAFRLSMNPVEAARDFIQVVHDRKQLQTLSENGKAWALQEGDGCKVAARMGDFYDMVLKAHGKQ